MQLLDLESGETVVQLYQKGMSKEAWPALQLTSDEALLAHMVNNTINIYKTRAFAEGKSVLRNMHALPLKSMCVYCMHVYHYCGVGVSCSDSLVSSLPIEYWVSCLMS